MTRGATTLRRRRLASAVVAAALVLAGGGPAGGQSELEEAQEGYDEAVAAEAEVLAAYDDAVAEAAALTAQVQALDVELAMVEAELAAASDAVVAADAELAAAEQELADTLAELARQQAILRQQAVDAYVGAGRAEGGSALAAIGADNANDAASITVYAGVVIEDRQDTIEQLQALEVRATQLRADASAAAARAAAARDEVAARRAQLTDTRTQLDAARAGATTAAANQEGLLGDIQAQRNSYLQRIAELTSASDGVAQILAARQAGQVLPSSTARIFGHPVTPMNVGSPFGPRIHPVYGGTRLHRGADLSAAMGQEIVAAGDGVVAISEVRGGYGNAVVIDHGNGLATLYAHQSRLLVSAGDVVRRGDVIGLVGSTGVSTGPHLHFEVRVFGDAVDPVPFLEDF